MIERFQFRSMLYVILGLALIGVLLSQYKPPARSLVDIQKSGELRVLATEAPGVYTYATGVSIGFDYDVLELFASELQVELKVINKPPFQLIASLQAGYGDLIVGSYLRSIEAVEGVSQSPTILQVPTVIAYQRGTKRPTRRDQLQSASVAYEKRIPNTYRNELIVGGTAYSDGYQMLQDLVESKVSTAMTTEDRLNVVRRYLPKLSVAFYPGSTVEKVWYLPQRPAFDLYTKLEKFTQHIRESGDLKRVAEQHFKTVESMHYLDLRAIEEAVSEVLPTYLDQFKKAAEQNGLDWELLAAVSYQESLWNPDAISPTGVRGMMQITEATAASLNLDDRTDVEQSINGSAEYLANILANIPDDITEPERTKLLLAAYNFGPEGINQAISKTRASWNKSIYWREVAKLGIREYALERPFPTSQKILNRGKQAEEYVKRVSIFRDILRYHDL
ncbi:MAG: transglycosylase SLT domain-containing protein [Arenicellaceae bacterium]|nr:transglycosylase SLT domain-containing protein [Arenicellaceae bacterium]